MKKNKVLVSIIIIILAYLFTTMLAGINNILGATDKLPAILHEFGSLWWLKLAIGLILAFIVYMMNGPTLDIMDTKAGHGQHGDARFMPDGEVSKHYTKVAFGKEKEPGFLVGLETNTWVIDSTDNNMMLLAPPGAGKTTAVYIPTVEYNARVNRNTGGKGASMILVDIKGTLYNKTAPLLQKAGYKTPCINLRHVFSSHHLNIMHRVNDEIDLYKAASSKKERAIHYGRAERYAKIAAASIFEGKDKSVSSEGSDYFNQAAKGLITGMMLMISEFAPDNARHILSVFDMIVRHSSQDETGAITGVQKTKLASMLEKVGTKRVQYYVGSAIGADIRTTLNVFSSAIGKLADFVDAELEQLICRHSSELDAEGFVDRPTAIFIICPDENPTRHFLASLFIRSFTNDLIELAETKYNEVLPRPFLYFLDEFGNLPSIQDVVSIFSAIRSRGGRILCALQSYAQLLDNYSRDKAKIIEDTCQMLMFSFVAPSAEETAVKLSKMLDNETILSGSSSVSKGVTTTSRQMIGRALLTPGQLVRLPRGTFITMKGGQEPYRAQLKGYWEYLDLEEHMIDPPPQSDFEDVVVVSPRFLEIMASGQQIKLERGMFD